MEVNTVTAPVMSAPVIYDSASQAPAGEHWSSKIAPSMLWAIVVLHLRLEQFGFAWFLNFSSAFDIFFSSNWKLSCMNWRFYSSVL